MCEVCSKYGGERAAMKFLKTKLRYRLPKRRMPDTKIHGGMTPVEWIAERRTELGLKGWPKDAQPEVVEGNKASKSSRARKGR